MIAWMRNETNAYSDWIDVLSPSILWGHGMGARATYQNAADVTVKSEYNIRAVYLQSGGTTDSKAIHNVPSLFLTGPSDDNSPYYGYDQSYGPKIYGIIFVL